MTHTADIGNSVDTRTPRQPATGKTGEPRPRPGSSADRPCKRPRSPDDLNREAWLEALIDFLRPAFARAGYPLPETLHVSVGFPSVISPLLPQREADHVLVHELVHAGVGAGGHRGAFRRCAVAVGLTGPMTATEPTDDLRRHLDEFAGRAGPYPHPVLTPHPQEYKGSRMKRWVCGCKRLRRVSQTGRKGRDSLPCMSAPLRVS